MNSLLAFLAACLIACIAPLFISIVDAYWWIFTDAQVTSIRWDISKVLVSSIFAIVGSGVILPWMKDVAEEIEYEL